MPYELTRDDLDRVTPVDEAFGTERLLPQWEEIPEEFKRGNVYTELVSAIFNGSELPKASMMFLDAFTDDGAPKALNRAVRAHLQSWAPKHEHKIAGVGFLISQVCKLEAAHES